MGYRETRGIILGRRNFMETDQIIHLLSPELGGVKARAPNARTSQEVYCGRLEPPNLVKIRLYQPREDARWLVSELEIAEAFAELLRDGSIRYRLWPLLALYRDLFPAGEKPHGCYERLVYGLEFIRNNSVDPLLVADRLLVKTAAETGIAPDFTVCVNCGREESNMWRLYPARGLFCERCFDSVEETEQHQLSGAVRSLYLILENFSWEEVLGHDFDPKSLANLESLMYRFFHYHFEISLQALNVRNKL